LPIYTIEKVTVTVIIRQLIVGLILVALVPSEEYLQKTGESLA
jgi:hypothetical protein